MSEDAQQDFEAMAAPTDEHRQLEPFVGTFRAEVKIWSGPGEPVVTTGTMVTTPDLGGRFLHQVYTGDGTEGPFPNFEGRGYLGFNQTTGEYEGFWIDNASTMMQTERGGVDESGKVWTMVGTMKDPQSGADVTKRSVITLEDDDHHSMEMYFDTPDGEMRAMAIAYTRAGA